MTLLEILQQSLEKFNALTENNTVTVDIDILDQGVADTVMNLLQEDPEVGTKLDVLLDVYLASARLKADGTSSSDYTPEEFQNGIYTWLVDSIKSLS